jgi:hypothetical protein
MAGWYWVRRAILRRNADALQKIHPGLVEATKDKNGTLIFYTPGVGPVWSFNDVAVAEWAGPVRPPADAAARLQSYD